jgi:hypothetical protein
LTNTFAWQSPARDAAVVFQMTQNLASHTLADLPILQARWRKLSAIAAQTGELGKWRAQKEPAK